MSPRNHSAIYIIVYIIWMQATLNSYGSPITHPTIASSSGRISESRGFGSAEHSQLLNQQPESWRLVGWLARLLSHAYYAAAGSTASPTDIHVRALDAKHLQRRELKQHYPCSCNSADQASASRAAEPILFPSGSAAAAAAISASSSGGQVLVMKIQLLPVTGTQIQHSLLAGKVRFVYIRAVQCPICCHCNGYFS